MRMIRFISIFLAATFVGAFWEAYSAEPGRATADEVVARVREAVVLLSNEGEQGLAALRKPASHFVWKDSYVFVADCESGIILANPYQLEREGKPIAAGATYAGVTAAERAAAQCAAAHRPNGGWWAYRFPEPGTQKIIRKVSYLLMVPGTNWLVGAGVYDATTSIEDLETATEAGR
jgi:cytochrome c